MGNFILARNFENFRIIKLVDLDLLRTYIVFCTHFLISNKILFRSCTELIGRRHFQSDCQDSRMRRFIRSAVSPHFGLHFRSAGRQSDHGIAVCGYGHLASLGAVLWIIIIHSAAAAAIWKFYSCSTLESTSGGQCFSRCHQMHFAYGW